MNTATNPVQLPKAPIECKNLISGQWVSPGGPIIPVHSPYTGQLIGQIHASGPKDVDHAARTAAEAAIQWRNTPLKERCAIMFQLRQLLLRDLDAIANSAARECGKTVAEARAGVLKGIEVLEFALSLQNLDQGGQMEVSRGVFCEFRREPLGVVAAITPFNFPAMVPMWMIPVAITLGNAMIWKPSDKTPLTSQLLGQAALEAGLPAGVLTIVQGGRETVEAILDHPLIRAIGFVGSTPVAKAVYARGSAAGKRVLALGGAKNHIILMPDAEPEMSARGITDSFTGCAGQRCMAASVLLAVNDDAGATDGLIKKIVAAAGQIQLGSGMGALITPESKAKLSAAIDRAEKEGAKILLDGRKLPAPAGMEGGNWLGPTILDNVKPGTEAARDELFGPILSIVRCKNLSDALAIEASNPFGNAASVFTQNGMIAERVAATATAGMVGINIGVPVPREPFSFGGIHDSKFGHGEITGAGSLGFWTDLKKVTTKWMVSSDRNWMS